MCALSPKGPDSCNCGGGRWEGRGEERNMADGGGQRPSDRRTHRLLHCHVDWIFI